MKDSDCVKLNSVNPLYLIIDKVDGCIEEKNGNKYLILDSSDKNKEVLIKYTELWDVIKNLVKKKKKLNRPSQMVCKVMTMNVNGHEPHLTCTKICAQH